MGLFGKKKVTVEDILKDIESLSEDELNVLKNTLNGGADNFENEDPAENDTPETEAEENGQADDAESSADDSEETVEENENAEDPTEDSAADEPIEQTVTEENPADEDLSEDVAEEPVQETAEDPADDPATEDSGNYAELLAKFEDLSKTVEALEARINADAENAEDDTKVEFGISQGNVGHEAEDVGEVEKCRSKYFNF